MSAGNVDCMGAGVTTGDGVIVCNGRGVFTWIFDLFKLLSTLKYLSCGVFVMKLFWSTTFYDEPEPLLVYLVVVVSTIYYAFFNFFYSYLILF